MFVPNEKSYYFQKAERLCGSSSYKSPRSMKIFAGFFAIPFTVTSMCNITLWILAYKEINRLSADPENHSEHFQSDNRVKKQLKSAFTVGIVVIVFCVTWLPCVIWNLHQAVTRVRIPPKAEYIIMWMGISNSSLNFFIFLAMNRKFRLGFVQLVKCKKTPKTRKAQYTVPSISHTCTQASNICPTRM